MNIPQVLEELYSIALKFSIADDTVEGFLRGTSLALFGSDGRCGSDLKPGSTDALDSRRR